MAGIHPPQGELQDQDIAPDELVHLGLQPLHISAYCARVLFLHLLLQPRRIGDGREVAAVRYRVEAHRMQIGDPH